jgi:hypothetical protein
MGFTHSLIEKSTRKFSWDGGKVRPAPKGLRRGNANKFKDSVPFAIEFSLYCPFTTHCSLFYLMSTFCYTARSASMTLIAKLHFKHFYWRQAKYISDWGQHSLCCSVIWALVCKTVWKRRKPCRALTQACSLLRTQLSAQIVCFVPGGEAATSLTWSFKCGDNWNTNVD